MTLPVATTHAILGLTSFFCLQRTSRRHSWNVPRIAYAVTSAYAALGIALFGFQTPELGEIYIYFFITQECLSLPFMTIGILDQYSVDPSIKTAQLCVALITWITMMVDDYHYELAKLNILGNGVLCAFTSIVNENIWGLIATISAVVAFMHIFNKSAINQETFQTINLLLSLYTFSSWKAMRPLDSE